MKTLSVALTFECIIFLEFCTVFDTSFIFLNSVMEKFPVVQDQMKVFI